MNVCKDMVKQNEKEEKNGSQVITLGTQVASSWLPLIMLLLLLYSYYAVFYFAISVVGNL